MLLLLLIRLVKQHTLQQLARNDGSVCSTKSMLYKSRVFAAALCYLLDSYAALALTN